MAILPTARRRIKMNKPITITADHSHLHIIVISAFRYALGRMSYVPSMVCEFITDQWSVLPNNTKQILIRELETEIKRNDEDSQDDRFISLLGNPCDVNQWKDFLEFMKRNNT